MSPGTDLRTLVRTIVLFIEFGMHAATLILTATAIHTKKAGAFAALQFSIDLVVILTIPAIVSFKSKRTATENWILNFIGFFAIFLFSLTGATGLAVHEADGNGFCEEFNTGVRGRCAGAMLVIGVSWATVIIAILGILVSWLDEYPRVVAMNKLDDPLPRIHISNPTTSYAASRPWVPHTAQGPTRPTQI